MPSASTAVPPRSDRAALSKRRLHYTQQSIQAARAFLQELPEIPEGQSLRSLVVELYDDIKRKREQGVDWSVIHSAINKHCAIGLRTIVLYVREEELRRAGITMASAFPTMTTMLAEGSSWDDLFEAYPGLGADKAALRKLYTAEKRKTSE